MAAAAADLKYRIWSSPEADLNRRMLHPAEVVAAAGSEGQT